MTELVLARTAWCPDLVAEAAASGVAATKYPGWAVAEVGSEAGVGVGVGVGLWLMLAVVRMAHRCRRWRSSTALGLVVDNKVKIGLIGAAAAAAADTKAVDVRQDSGVGVASGGMAQVEPAGAVDTE
jgi:hypothetical protein